MRMGYRRHQGGLGKNLQGIEKPIEVLSKPLPPGLGLDFINENKEKSIIELTNERIKNNIINNFNNNFNQKKKQIENDSNTSCFDFLNKIDNNIKINKSNNNNNNNIRKNNYDILNVVSKSSSVKKEKKNVF